MRGILVMAFMGLSAAAQTTRVATDQINFTQSGAGATARTVDAKLKEFLSVKDYGAKGDGTTDDAAAVLAAIAAAPIGATVRFPHSASGYRVGALGSLLKALTLDFGGNQIFPDTTGTWLTISRGNDITVGKFPVLMNGIFRKYAAVVATDIFVVDSDNMQFNNINFFGAEVSHALIWHKSAYGVRINGGVYHYNTAPNLIYASDHLMLDEKYAYTLEFTIEGVDMSNTAGRCLGIEGGKVTILHSVIESCSLGGVEHVAYQDTLVGWNLDITMTDIHFEGNSLFNVKFPPKVHIPDGVDVMTTAAIRGSMFGVNPNQQILYLGGDTQLSFFDNQIDGACIDGDPAHAEGRVYYGNNIVWSAPSSCDPAQGNYLFKSTLAGIYRMGHAKGGEFRVQDYNPTVFRTLSGQIGWPIVRFQDEIGTEKAYITREGTIASAGMAQAKGFQDTTTAAKPACDATTRGLSYVEKGTGPSGADVPQDCVQTNSTGPVYGWAPRGGTNDHAALSNLDYAHAGHTGFVPATRSVNGHALGGDVIVTAADAGAVPTTRTVAGHPLSGDVTIVAGDVSGLGGAATLNVGASAGTVAAGNDARLSDARTPTVHAASHASGQADAITPASIGAAPATNGSGVLKGDGTGGTAAAAAADIVGLFSGCSGTQSLGADGACHASGGGSVNVNGSSVASPNFNATTPAAEAGKQNVTFQVSGSSVSAEIPAAGTTAGTFAAGNDARLSDARTPTAHAASHASGQADALTPAAIGAVPTTTTVNGQALSGNITVSDCTTVLGAGTDQFGTPAAGSLICVTGNQTLTAAVTVANANVKIRCNPGIAITQTAAALGFTLSGTDSGIEGCTLDGNSQATVGPLVSMSGTRNYVRNSWVQNHGTTNPAIYSISSDSPEVDQLKCLAPTRGCIQFTSDASHQVKNFRITRSHFLAGTTDVSMIEIDRPNGALKNYGLIEANTCDLKGNGGAMLCLYALGQAGNDQLQSLRVIGNHCGLFGNNNGGCFQLFGVDHSTVVGNTCQDNNFFMYLGCIYGGDFWGSTVAGNNCYMQNSTSGACIVVVDGSGNSITGNTCEGIQASGNYKGCIQITTGASTQHCDGNVISGNQARFKANAAVAAIRIYPHTASSTCIGNAIVGNQVTGTNATGQIGIEVSGATSFPDSTLVANNQLYNIKTGINVVAGVTNTVIEQSPGSFASVATASIADSGTGTSINGRTKYSLVKIANGSGGCVNANGCWSVNGGTAVAATATLTQDVVLFALPAGAVVHNYRIKTAVICGTSGLTGLGTTASDVVFNAQTYDINAAVTATNFVASNSAASLDTLAGTNVVASIKKTGSTVDLLTNGCAVDYIVGWSLMP